MNKEVMTKFVKSRYFTVAILSLLSLCGVMAAGLSSERQTAKQILHSMAGLEAKYNTLFDEFGQVPHFYDAISASMLREGFSVLELLTIDEQAVKTEHQAEYANIAFPSLPDALHLHFSQDTDHVAITVGGYPFTALEQMEDGKLVMVLENVTSTSVRALEAIIDDRPFTHVGDNNGRVRYTVASIGYKVKITGEMNFGIRSTMLAKENPSYQS